MVDMIICGLSMEMEIAEMRGVVGKCRGCNHLGDAYSRNYCTKHQAVILNDMLGCNDWLVEMR